MSLDRMRKSLQSLLGIQSNSQNEQPSQVSRQSQSEYRLQKSDQKFKNKFVIIQKKQDKLNPYKYALERLKEYNLTMQRANDLLNCPIISYKLNKEEKRIHENIVTKPRWKQEESSQEIINIKSEDDRKNFFFHASYIKDGNPQPSQSKQTAKKLSVQQRNSYSEYNFEKEKQTVENISKSNKQNQQEDNNQSESESIYINDKKSETKFRKLNPSPQEIIQNQDLKQITGKKETQNFDDIQTSKKPTVQAKEIQEKQPEIQVPQQIQTNSLITENQKVEIVENKQQQQQYIIEPQVEQQQITNQVLIAPDVNPFTQNIQNQLFNPPWLDNSLQSQQNQVSFNLFQQPLIQQQPQIQQPIIMQPMLFQNPVQQEQQSNLFPFQNQQTQNVFSNQNLFNQQPNLFQNNQQSQQSFNLFNQNNQFQQQQPIQQSLFQQQQPSSESLFQQQPSTMSLFQQQPQSQQLFQQQPSIFQQQQSSTTNLFNSQSSNQLFQQPNQQTYNLFANNDQKQNAIDLFSAQTVQNTPNLFQQNQNQQSLFSLNTQQQTESQSNNTAQQRSYSHSDRYKKNLSKYTTERIE